MMQNFPCSGAASSSTSNTLSAMETMLADAWYDEEADRYMRKKSRGGKHGGKLMTPAEFPTLIGNRCMVANKLHLVREMIKTGSKLFHLNATRKPITPREQFGEDDGAKLETLINGS